MKNQTGHIQGKELSLPSPFAFKDSPGKRGESAVQKTASGMVVQITVVRSEFDSNPAFSTTTCVVLGRPFKFSVSVSSPVKWE